MIKKAFVALLLLAGIGRIALGVEPEPKRTAPASSPYGAIAPASPFIPTPRCEALWNASTLMAAAGAVPCSQVMAFAAPLRAARTWSAAADGALASAGASWNGSVVLATGDVVTFNNTSVHTCNWDTSTSVAGITVASTYSGTITCSVAPVMTAAYSQAAGTWNCNGFAFNVGANTFTLSGGTFLGSTQAITTGAVTFSGGALTATSGTWALGGSWTRSNTPTFTHNSGTINITAAATITDTGSTFNLFTINSAGIVTEAASTTMPLGASPTTSTGGTNNFNINGTVTWSGTWTQTGVISANNGSTLTGTATPKISINGQIIIGSTATVTNTIGTVTFTGATAASLTDTGDKLSASTTIVSNTGGFTVSASTTARLGGNPSSSVGAANTLTNNGTITYSGAWSLTGNLTAAASSTTTGSVSPSLTLAQNGSLNISATASAWTSVNVTINGTGGGATYTDTGAKNSGTWTFSNTNGYTIAASTTASVGANSSQNFNSGNNTLTVSGTLSFSGSLTVRGAMNVGAGGTLTGTSTPTLTINNSLTINATATITNPIGTVTVNYDGVTAFGMVWTDTGDKLSASTCVVSQGASASTFTVAASTTVRLGATPTSSTGTGTLTVTGTLTYSGVWTHTGSISLGGACTLTGTATPTLSLDRDLTAGGTITNPIGTITFTGSAANSTYTDTGNKLSGSTIVVNKTAANFTVAASTTARLGANPISSNGTGTTTVTGTLTYSGAWTHTGNLSVSAATGTVTGSATPSLVLTGNLTISATAAGWTSVNILSNGTASPVYTDTAAKNSGTWTITKSADANFTIAASTSCSLGANPTATLSVTAGATLTVTGTLTFSGNFTLVGAIQVDATGTVTGSATPTLTISRGLTLTSGATWPATMPITCNSANSTQGITATANTLGTVTIAQTGTGGVLVQASTTVPLGANPTSTVGSGALTVTGTLTYSGAWSLTGSLTTNASSTVTGSASPSLALTGNLTLNATSTWTSVNVLANGAAQTVYTDTAAKNSGTWTISKVGAGDLSCTISSGTTMNVGANPTIATGGTGVLLIASGTLQASGAISCAAGLNFTGTGTLSGAVTAINVTEGSLSLLNTNTIPSGMDVTFSITSATARNFRGAGFTFGTLRYTGNGGGTLNVTGSNTFTTLRDNDASAAHALTFTAGTTQTAASFALGGASGAVLTLNSSSGGSAATLHKTTVGDVNMAWLSVKDITVDARPEWFAGDHSTSVSGNTNVLFVINPRLRKWAGF